jgi:hypothetical protein
LVATIEKDNYHQLHGKTFQWPQFDHFKPHFEAMRISAGVNFRERKPPETDVNRIKDNHEAVTQSRRNEYLEIIERKLAIVLPKQNKESKGIMGEILEFISGTSAWSRWKKLDPDELKLYAGMLDSLAECKLSGRKMETWSQIKDELIAIQDLYKAKNKARETENGHVQEGGQLAAIMDEVDEVEAGQGGQ